MWTRPPIRDGWPSFTTIAMDTHSQIVRLLPKKHTDVRATMNAGDRHGPIELYVAVAHGPALAMVQAILEADSVSGDAGHAIETGAKRCCKCSRRSGGIWGWSKRS